MRFGRDEFIEQLGELGLLPPEELEPLRNGDPSQTADALAKDLVKRKKLTLFQAQQIAAGKGKALVLGSYVILDKLGQGGMGLVLLAEHRKMKRTVALKVLSPAVTKSPQTVARFQREVEAAARLDHPNIVTAHDAGEADGRHFYVMQYVPGSDLSSLVKKEGPLPGRKAVDYVLQAARGLEYAHQQGIIHRDIKPANLLLDKQGVIKILDMGLARFDDAAQGQAELTNTGAVLGTIDFMAPEQALNSKTADARSDVYSLGMTLWFLLTGKPAYDGPTLTSRLMAHQTQPIPSLSGSISTAIGDDLVSVLEPVFQKMVAKQPGDRFQTMRAVIAALDSCLSGTALTAAEPMASVTLSQSASGIRAAKTGTSASGTAQDSKSRLVMPPPLPSMQTTISASHTPDATLASSTSVIPPRRGIPIIGLAVGLLCVLGVLAAGVAYFTQGRHVVPPRVTTDTSQTGATEVVPPEVSEPPGRELALEVARPGDNIQLPSFEFIRTDGSTMEMWLTDRGGDQAIELWSMRAPGRPAIVFERERTDTFTGVVRYGFERAGTVPYAQSNKRFHVAACWLRLGKEVHFRFYLNGRTELRNSATLTAEKKNTGRVPPKHDFALGRVMTGGSDTSIGLLLHQFRLSETARYLSDFKPPAELKVNDDTLVLYHFDKDTGEVAVDLSDHQRDGKIAAARFVPVPSAE